MKETLALVGIVKNETKYIIEWIAHYRSIGIKNIVLYDNESDEAGRTLLQKLSAAKIITLVPWSVEDGVSPQMSAYADALQRLKGSFEFVAFFDADEFLAIREGLDIIGWLAALDADVSAVAVNQRVFGSSGYKTGTDEPVTARFIHAAEEQYSENRWVKSIYRAQRVQYLLTPHRGVLTSGRYILPCGRDAFEPENLSGQAQEVDFSVMRLHHYIIKSLEEFMEKRARGGGAGATREQRMGRYQDLGFFHGRDVNINKDVDTSLSSRAPIVLTEIDDLRKSIATASGDH